MVEAGNTEGRVVEYEIRKGMGVSMCGLVGHYKGTRFYSKYNGEFLEGVDLGTRMIISYVLRHLLCK